MENLPDALRVPDGPEKLVLPSRDLPVSELIKLDLPPQRKSSTFTDPSDYLSDRPPTLTTFNVLEIPVPHVKDASHVNAAAPLGTQAAWEAKSRFFEPFSSDFVTCLEDSYMPSRPEIDETQLSFTNFYE
ncbi:hypothetical protein B0H14DRAFT_2588249 [Mycena olivaceomarginata]|nr:hypothetical protein B0H14DRAFT_2588249 [Mycena olivaceomarginata]